MSFKKLPTSVKRAQVRNLARRLTDSNSKDAMMTVFDVLIDHCPPKAFDDILEYAYSCRDQLRGKVDLSGLVN